MLGVRHHVARVCQRHGGELVRELAILMQSVSKLNVILISNTFDMLLLTYARDPEV